MTRHPSPWLCPSLKLVGAITMLGFAAAAGQIVEGDVPPPPWAWAGFGVGLVTYFAGFILGPPPRRRPSPRVHSSPTSSTRTWHDDDDFDVFGVLDDPFDPFD